MGGRHLPKPRRKHDILGATMTLPTTTCSKTAVPYALHRVLTFPNQYAAQATHGHQVQPVSLQMLQIEHEPSPPLWAGGKQQKVPDGASVSCSILLCITWEITNAQWHSCIFS